MIHLELYEPDLPTLVENRIHKMAAGQKEFAYECSDFSPKEKNGCRDWPIGPPRFIRPQPR
jgi:hypothetical protein